MYYFSGGFGRLECCGVYCLCVSPFLVFVWRGGRSRRVVFGDEMRLMLDGGCMALLAWLSMPVHVVMYSWYYCIDGCIIPMAQSSVV